MQHQTFDFYIKQVETGHTLKFVDSKTQLQCSVINVLNLIQKQTKQKTIGVCSYHT
jgi:hypothetical protein